MKKKPMAFLLSGLLSIGVLAPIGASAAEKFNYGYDKEGMFHFAEYYHSSKTHAAGITKKDIPFKSVYVAPGITAGLKLDYTVPYKVSYQKYTL